MAALRIWRVVPGLMVGCCGWDVVHVIEPDQTWSPGDPTSPELPLSESLPNE